MPFCSVRSDHALEQESKTMKLTGGVIGLTQNQAALHRFCLVAPFLGALSKEFYSQHYQMAGLTKNIREFSWLGLSNQRISTMLKK